MSQLKLKEIDDSVGIIVELTAREKAQLKMTYWVLAGAAAILVLSGSAYIFTDGVGIVTDITTLCRAAVNENTAKEICGKYSAVNASINSSAKEVFDFCKAFLPPIVTLVLGAHYVTRNMEG